ncbi:MAG: DUF4157 domain-containing protein [Methylobacter sp.]|jgi:hypothetical protein|uniref:eCIS core domain-containing protein n=1 Tax=Methylobacter sp. TaxID=2051955 RepID=UPI0025FCD291|nr:DUF4157 domain-containing protein [Methylobacter sp.]MCK9621371.1 DUF4157 domain-containing protein [Methylobacter sp.]
MTAGKVKAIEKTQKSSDPSSPTHAFARQSSVGMSPGGFDATSVPQMAGNLAVQRLFRSGHIQAKLAISRPGDPDEEEADRVAEQVMRMAEPGESPSIGVFVGAKVVKRCAACEAEEEKWRTSAQAEGSVRVRRKCAECEAEDKKREEEHPNETKKERLQRKPMNDPSMVNELPHVTSVARSGGQPLDAGTRAFMESRFGFDFSQVRVHTDSSSAEAAGSVNARAYTLGSDVVFASGQYSPATDSGRRLLAHELTHVVQQDSGTARVGVSQSSTGSLRVLARAPSTPPAGGAGASARKTYSSPTVKTLLADTPRGDVPNKIIGDHGAWLSKATDAERLDLISACLIGESNLAGQAIDLCWFHCANWQAVARSNLSLWQRSLTAMMNDSLPGPFFKNLMDTFLFDTEEVARGYLDMNEEYCKKTLGEMFYDMTGQPMTGPPTPQQEQARKSPVNAEKAQELLDMQYQLNAARNTAVGYLISEEQEAQEKKEAKAHDNEEVEPEKGSPPGGTTWKPKKENLAYFDPAKAPPFGPRRDDKVVTKTWDQVKPAYEKGVDAIHGLLALHPKLYLLVRDNVDDKSKTSQIVADGELKPDATKIIAKELADTVANINKTRPLMSKVLAQELKPIQQQLLTGTTSSPRQPGRNWATDPLWKPAADGYVKQTAPRVWWQSLGLSALEMGVYIIAGIATGGVVFAAAMAAKGIADAAAAEGKKQALQAAAGSNVSSKTMLVSGKQVEEAEVETAMAIAFAALDVLGLGAEVRGVVGAAKAALVPGEQAVRAIQMSQDVLGYEKKLLGQIVAKDALETAEKAKALAAEARKLADEAKTLSKGHPGDGVLAGRARMADKAATRAEEGAKRVEDLARATETAQKAAKGVPEAELVAEFSVPLEGGGKIVVTKNGQVFVCASPCSILTERFADVIARNPELARRAVAVRMAEQETETSLKTLEGAQAKAVKARLAALEKSFKGECEMWARAEGVVTWLQGDAAATYPALKGKKINAGSVVRILEKKTENPAKGQLLEELGGADVLERLGTVQGRQQFAGQFAGEELIFVPSYMVRDSKGRQLTDGMVGFWKGETFQIVTIIESKAGKWASEGLKYSTEELAAVSRVRFRLIRERYKVKDLKGAQDIREQPFEDFVKANQAKIDEAVKLAESDSDWRKVAMEDYHARVVQELRAKGSVQEADRISKLGTSEFGATLTPMEQAHVDSLLPLPEAGQFTKDLERTGEMGGAMLNPHELPKVMSDGKVSSQWPSGKKGDVPAGTWKPTQFAGNRGSVKMQGYVTNDADAAKIAANARDTEGLAADVTKVDLSTDEIGKLAKEILKRGRPAKK